MALSQEQQEFLAVDQDKKFYAKFGWSSGPQDFFRLCGSYQPNADERLHTEDALFNAFELQQGGDDVSMHLQMPELLKRIVISFQLETKSSCRGCLASSRVGIQFCLLAMVQALEYNNFGGQQLLSILDSVEPVENCGKDPAEMKKCFHKVN